MPNSSGDASPGDAANSGRRFNIVPQDFWPDRALRPGQGWGANIAIWRDAVIEIAPPRSGKIIALAWVISDLAAKEGYAFAANPALASMVRIARNKVDDLLRELEQNRMLFRAHVSRGNAGIQRRIWPLLPSSSVIPSVQRHPSKLKSYQSQRRRFPASEIDAARMDSERREGKGAASAVLDEIRRTK